MKTKAFLCIALLCLLNISCKEKPAQPNPNTHLSVMVRDNNDGEYYEIYNSADDMNLEFKTLFESRIKKAKRVLLWGIFLPKEYVLFGCFDIFIRDANGNIVERYHTVSPTYLENQTKPTILDYNFHKDFYNYLGRLYLKDSKLNAAYIYLYSSLTLEDFYTCYGYATLAQRFEGQASVNIADIASEYSEKSASPKDLYNRIGRAFFEDSRFLLDLARFMGRRATIEDFYTCYGYVKFLEYSNAQ